MMVRNLGTEAGTGYMMPAVEKFGTAKKMAITYFKQKGRTL